MITHCHKEVQIETGVIMHERSEFKEVASFQVEHLRYQAAKLGCDVSSTFLRCRWDWHGGGERGREGGNSWPVVL